MARVAFQGEHGAYSEIAAELMWPGAECVPCRESADVVRAIESGTADVGVLPIENSIAGPVAPTLDALGASADVQIITEVVVPIQHCLLVLPGTSLADIRWVESHPVALAQCGAFFGRHPSLQPRAAYDTAGAARDIAAAGDPARAAVACAAAAARYGLTILMHALEDTRDNRTRFVGLSRRGVEALRASHNHGRDTGLMGGVVR